MIGEWGMGDGDAFLVIGYWWVRGGDHAAMPDSRSRIPDNRHLMPDDWYLITIAR